MTITMASVNQLRVIYDEANPIARQAIDAELERRHQASIRRERRNLAVNKVGGWV